MVEYVSRLNRSDFDGAMELLHPDYVEDYPQSGERIRGPDNLRATIDNYPGGVGAGVGGTAAEAEYFGADEQWAIAPNYTVVKVADAGNTGTAILKIRYPDGSDWWMVALFELRDDKLIRQTSFFGQPFEAPEWRAQWVERDQAQPA
jgi:hypothetical protein